MTWQAVTLILGLAFIAAASFTALVSVIAWTSSLENRVETVMKSRQQGEHVQHPPDLKLVD